MSKTYRAWDPDQTYLLPPSPRDWLADGDLVYFMLDVVQTMDLSPITRKYENEDRGARPYHPRMKVSNKGFDQCGNAQAVANEEQIIIAADVTPQANDKRQVVPMVEQSQENLRAADVDEKIGAFDADTGYFSEESASYLEDEKIDPHIATERLKHHEKIPLVPKGRPPKDLTASNACSPTAYEEGS